MTYICIMVDKGLNVNLCPSLPQHENPLYVNPQQDYKNVAYRARKRSTKLQ